MFWRFRVGALYHFTLKTWHVLDKAFWGSDPKKSFGQTEEWFTVVTTWPALLAEKGGINVAEVFPSIAQIHYVHNLLNSIPSSYSSCHAYMHHSVFICSQHYGKRSWRGPSGETDILYSNIQHELYGWKTIKDTVCWRFHQKIDTAHNNAQHKGL